LVAESLQVATWQVKLEVKLNLSKQFDLHLGDLKLEGIVDLLSASARPLGTLAVIKEELCHMFHTQVLIINFAG
jgi:hypothetical protein